MSDNIRLFNETDRTYSINEAIEEMHRVYDFLDEIDEATIVIKDDEVVKAFTYDDEELTKAELEVLNSEECEYAWK